MKTVIQEFAVRELGFDDCKFCSPFLNDSIKETYRRWLKEGHAGDMTYLERHWPLKEDPSLLLPGVQSAVMVIKNYKNTFQKHLTEQHKVARYAVGQDYHMVMTAKLKQLEDFLCTLVPDVKTFRGVDSRPLAERSLALKAGIGFLGKNTMVIKPGLGSYFFIAGILTTLPLEEDTPLAVHCGSCRLCVDACPTQALQDDYTMKATQCISYMTIEQKEALKPEQKAQVKDWIYGCDICQEACPYNHGKAPLTNWTEFLPQSGVGFDFFDQMDKNEAQEWPTISKQTPLYRARRQIKENWLKKKS